MDRIIAAALALVIAATRLAWASVPPDAHLEARSAESRLMRGASAAIPVATRFEPSGAPDGSGWAVPVEPLEPGEIYSFEGASFVVDDGADAPCYATPMKMTWFALFVLAACGGSVRGGSGGGASQVERYADEAPGSKASLGAFDEVLAPLWHAPDTPARTDDTCAAVPKLERLSQDVGDAPLVESVQALAAECTGDRAAFKTKFASVHDAFHAAMEKSGAKEEAHEEPKAPRE